MRIRVLSTRSVVGDSLVIDCRPPSSPPKQIIFRLGSHVDILVTRTLEKTMTSSSIVPLIEIEDASPEVRAVYDDIMKTRGTDWINNFWKVAGA